jgi:ribonuclease J
MPDERVLIVCTGSQGEEFSALVRMASNTYKDFVLRPGDVVLLSTHTIPGNEKAVIDMINNLITIGIDIVDDHNLDVHSSGHGYQEDIKTMLSLLKPQYYMPIHGEPFMKHANKKLGLSMGIPSQHVLLPNNGQVVELYDQVSFVSEKKIKLDTVMIDGKGQGHMSGEYVMKARGIMAENGIVALVFKVDTKSKELIGNIQIESRGFVYSSEVKTIHTQIVDFARAKYLDNQKKRLDIKENLRRIKDDLGEYITKIIGRVPMIMPMFVYINRDPQAQGTDLSLDDAIVGMTLDEQGYDD